MKNANGSVIRITSTIVGLIVAIGTIIYFFGNHVDGAIKQHEKTPHINSASKTDVNAIHMKLDLIYHTLKERLDRIEDKLEM